MPILTLITDTGRTTAYSDALEIWAAAFSAETGGSYTIEIFYPGEIVPAFETFDALTVGIVDLAFLTPSFYEASLPGVSALGAPFSGGIGAEIAEDLYEVFTSPAVADGIFNTYNIAALAASTTLPYLLGTNSGRGDTPGDLHGQKILATGVFARDLIAANGASIVNIPATEQYTALQTGIIDGVIQPADLLVKLRLAEVLQDIYVPPNGAGFQTLAQALLINGDVLAGLPPEIRTALIETTGIDLSRTLGAAAETTYAQNLSDLAAETTVNTLSGNDLAAWEANAAAALSNYLASLEGLSPAVSPDYTGLLDREPVDPGTPPEVSPLPGIAEFDAAAWNGGSFAIIVPQYLGVLRFAELDGATVAMPTGTTMETAFNTAFRALNISYEPISISNYAEARQQFLAGVADVLVVPASALTGDLDLGSFTIVEERLAQDGTIASVSEPSLTGDTEDNTLTGTTGADLMIGGEGRDSIAAGDGDDVLVAGTLFTEVTSSGAQIYRVYEATLGRQPDLAGLEGWVTQLDDGTTTLETVVGGFTRSKEFQMVYGAVDDRAFVTLLYDNVLDRDPDSEGLAGWLSALSGGRSRESVVIGFSESAEFKSNTSGPALAFAEALEIRAQTGFLDDVYRLYQTTLNRAPDTAGIEHWSGQLAEGEAYLTVAGGFTQSREFKRAYGALADGDFVDLLYQNVLGREGDAGGRAGWLRLLEQGETREGVVRGFAQSGEFARQTAADFTDFMAGIAGDTLDGGAGNNILLGGIGADTFVFSPTAQRTVILNADAWDTVQISGSSFDTEADARAALQQTGADVTLSDGAMQIVFAGSTLAGLDGLGFDLI